MNIYLEYPHKKSLEVIAQKVQQIQGPLEYVCYFERAKLIMGDNFEIMAKLLKEYQNRIDLVYIDPPYNTCQNFTSSKNRTATISKSSNDNLAYCDNLPLQDYLEFMRERFFLIWQLMSPQGSLYVHTDIKNGPYLRMLLDEIFGKDNFLNEVSRVKSNPKNFKRKAYGNVKDIIYFYAKKRGQNIFNHVKEQSTEELPPRFKKIDKEGRYYTTIPCHAPGETKNGATGGLWKGRLPPKGRHWRVSPDVLEELDRQGHIEWSKNANPRIKKYAQNYQGNKIQDIWSHFKDPQYPLYPTQKNKRMLDLIVCQSSREDSIIMDCFCGSGSFLQAGLAHMRQVIGIDASEIAIELSKVAIKSLQSHLVR
ncbi:site-specific DNA-methyltransferase [Helicobacter suis]|uniref:site-specific DNA-methyltransferase n=1 Tax=Helicobacter suis TaxID=104628 RepID=UPI001F083E91|nr:site-specific DNA-methyltransferase [Helicobacter suis]